MRILFFIHSLSSGGAERVTSTLANHWVKQGWGITIVTIAGQNWDFYELHPGIRRFSLNLDADSSNIFDRLRNNWQRILGLRRVLKAVQPDVAVAIMPTANALLAMANTGLGISGVGSERIHPPCMPLGKMWEFLRRHTYKCLDAVIAQTNLSAQWLAANTGAKRERVSVIPNPLNYPLAVKEPRLLPPEKRVTSNWRHLLLAVGRLDRQKGFDRLLEVFSAIANKHPSWGLVILGEGVERERLEAQCREKGLNDRVLLPGAVGNVGEWYEIADLYVLTSRFEGFPNTLLEALAYGLSSVAVDCETGPREIIRHELDGLLVPQDDPRALISALDRLMSDEKLRARFSKRAIEARERFAVERISGQWEQLFQECMYDRNK